MADPGADPRRSLSQWMVAAEAAVWVGVAGLAVRTLAFSRLTSLAGAAWPPTRQQHGARRADVHEIARCVEAAARRAPWPVLCLEKALAGHAMLRLRGHASVLCYGARMETSRRLTAHAWVELDGAGVIGGEEAAGYAVLAAFAAGAREAPR